MVITKKRITLLLNWYANPYHAPIFVAKELGFYEQEGTNNAFVPKAPFSEVAPIVRCI